MHVRALLRIDNEVDEATDVPVLINISFNTCGESIVFTPRDAGESFWTAPLEAFVIGSFLLEKRGAV